MPAVRYRPPYRRHNIGAYITEQKIAASEKNGALKKRIYFLFVLLKGIPGFIFFDRYSEEVTDNLIVGSEYLELLLLSLRKYKEGQTSLIYVDLCGEKKIYTQDELVLLSRYLKSRYKISIKNSDERSIISGVSNYLSDKKDDRGKPMVMVIENAEVTVPCMPKNGSQLIILSGCESRQNSRDRSNQAKMNKYVGEMDPWKRSKTRPVPKTFLWTKNIAMACVPPKYIAINRHSKYELLAGNGEQK